MNKIQLLDAKDLAACLNYACFRCSKLSIKIKENNEIIRVELFCGTDEKELKVFQLRKKEDKINESEYRLWF